MQLFVFAVVLLQYLDGLLASSCPLPRRDPDVIICGSYRREIVFYRPAPGLGKPETRRRST